MTVVFVHTKLMSWSEITCFQIQNYQGRAKMVVSLVTDEQVPRPHAHELIGKNCKNGTCVVEINRSDMTAR